MCDASTPLSGWAAVLERRSWWLVVGLALVARLIGLERKSMWFLLQHFWLPLYGGDRWLRLPAAVAGALSSDG